MVEYAIKRLLTEYGEIWLLVDFEWKQNLASPVRCTAHRPREGILRHIQSISYKYI